MNNILVTGAAGFIGSHLCDKLLQQGYFVVGIDNFDDFYDMSIKKDNISSALLDDKFTFIKSDIRDISIIDNIMTKYNIDVIFHLAAKAGVRPSIENPHAYIDVNIKGTEVLLESAKKYNITKFIFASSSSVYGNNKKIPFNEMDNVDFPISPYAATKKAGELLCYTYHYLYNINITCLRFFTVYGPRQRPDLAIYKFINNIILGESIPVFGNGYTQRDYTYINDIITGTIAAMNECRGFEIYNLGNSNPIRLDQLIINIEQVLDKKAIIERLPMFTGDALITCANIDKAKNKLNYFPRTNLNNGLVNFIKWFKEKKI